jgi:TPP-dependent pyruvate/acetoin dehydrogenase alpha subunit
LRRRLEEEEGVTSARLDGIERQERETIADAVVTAEASEFPAADEALDDLFAERVS